MKPSDPRQSQDNTNPSTAPVVDRFWTSKPVLFGLAFAIAFLGILYLAIANEPDYMPANKKGGMTHDMTQMNHDNVATSMTPDQQAKLKQEAQAMGMTEQEHLHMQHSAAAP